MYLRSDFVYPKDIFLVFDIPTHKKPGVISQAIVHSTFRQDSWYLLFTRHFHKTAGTYCSLDISTRQLVPIVHSTFPQDSWYILFTQHFHKTAGTYCSLDISQDSWYLLFTRHFTRQLVPIVHSTFPQDSWYLLFTRHFTRQLVPIVHSTFPQDSWYLEQTVWVGRCQSDYVTQQLLVVVKNEVRRHLRHSATLDHVLRELGRLSPHEAHNALVCFPRGHLVSGGSGENVQGMSATLVIRY